MERGTFIKNILEKKRLGPRFEIMLRLESETDT